MELTLHSLVLGLTERGHCVEVVAPEGSLLVGEHTHQIAGALQRPSQNAGRDAPVEMPARSVLAAMWAFVAEYQDDFDVVVNMAYDWLPMYLAPMLRVPVAHIVSMASLSDAMDAALVDLLAARPGSAAVHSHAQAATFTDVVDDLTVIGNGIAVERYEMHLTADSPASLGFVGRISAEKGIDDVFALSERSRHPVKVWGLMQDEGCWHAAAAAHPHAEVTYEGFLPTDELQAAIGGCSAVVMTPKWVEAFGNVAIEAMACGVPVIAYRRGGPSEVVVDGVTGFLVEPDDVDALVDAVAQISDLDRIACRQRVEEEFSTAALAVRTEAWLEALLARYPRPVGERGTAGSAGSPSDPAGLRLQYPGH